MAGSRGKHWIFWPLVFLEIESFVAQGLSAAEIAEKIGCKLGSLRVKCSQNGISLRRRIASSAATSKDQLPRRLRIWLSEEIAANLQRQADKMGMSRADLAITILDAIARDNLYDAVIDRDAVPKIQK